MTTRTIPPVRPDRAPTLGGTTAVVAIPIFTSPDLGSERGVSIPQLSNRVELLRRLDDLRRHADEYHAHPTLQTYDANRAQAMRLLRATRPGKRNPFDLTQESEATRDLYGREEWGQGFLVARRLVEAGVRMVQINLRGWDTHQNAFRDLKGKLLPSIDHCLSGFLDDLADRGLLDETLVVMCGEMGRTPRISPITAGAKNASGEIFTPGRHHWGDVFPCFFAGGGIQPGRVVGATDNHGGLPVTEAYTPADLAATIFGQLGVGSRSRVPRRHRPPLAPLPWSTDPGAAVRARTDLPRSPGINANRFRIDPSEISNRQSYSPRMLGRRTLSSRVPEIDGPVFCGGGEVEAVGTEGNGVDFVGMIERKDLLAGDDVPDADGSVGAGRGEPVAVGAEGDAVDIVGVAPKGQKFSAGGRVPNLHGAIDAGRGQERAVGG